MMAKIRIEDLPQVDEVSLEQMQDILGGEPADAPLRKVYQSLTAKRAPAPHPEELVVKPRKKGPGFGG